MASFLSDAPADIIRAILSSMDLKQRFTCALVCSEWAAAAKAATSSIVMHGQTFKNLQRWLMTNGSQITTLHYHGPGVLRRLHCPQLQNLLLDTFSGTYKDGGSLVLAEEIWDDIAAATKLTSVTLKNLCACSKQAEVVSALTALPDLQQLTWGDNLCHTIVRDFEPQLVDSRLLQKLTKLTGLELSGDTAEEVLEHVSKLSNLQHLHVSLPGAWNADNHSGLQALKRLTSLELGWCADKQLPPSITHLTALQHLEAKSVTGRGLDVLTVLTALTQLSVNVFRASEDLNTPNPAPLLLPALRQLHIAAPHSPASGWRDAPILHASYLASCTQLRQLSLSGLLLHGPGSLVASSMLQELSLGWCSLRGWAPEDGSWFSSWTLVFPDGGQLPHLTSLSLHFVSPAPDSSDVIQLVECCRGLRVLQLEFEAHPMPKTTGMPLLMYLQHLTMLQLHTVNDKVCSDLSEVPTKLKLPTLARLRELHVSCPQKLSPVGLQHLAALEQLTCMVFRCCKFPEFKSMLQEQMSDTLQGYNLTFKQDGPMEYARLLRA